MISRILSRRGRDWRAAAGIRFSLAVVLALSSGVSAQTAGDSAQDKSFDVRSSVGDMHVGAEVGQREIGLPAYPGARLRQHDQDGSNANLALFTSAFGVKLVVAHYDSDDDAAKIVAFYRGKLKKYGKVLECRSHDAASGHDGVDINEGGKSSSKELKCEGDNTGSVVELKVGTEDNQHVVAIEPGEKGKGATFEIVYVYTRGKRGEI